MQRVGHGLNVEVCPSIPPGIRSFKLIDLESCSHGSFLVVLSLGDDVGLGVGSLNSWGGSEVSLGFSILVSSQEESSGTYTLALISNGYYKTLQLKNKIEESRYLFLKASRLTSGSGEDELVESDALSSSLDDSGSGGLGESKRSNGHLWNIKKSIVISHGANSNDDFVPTMRGYFDTRLLTGPSGA